MASSSADIHQVDVHQLASRLAPEVLDEAMADAREQARRRLAAALAEEIVAAALAGDMPAERPPAPTGTRLASSHRTRSRPGAAGTATSPATAEAATASPANTSPAPASPASADPASASPASADSARLADTRPAAQAAKPARERARPAAPAARGRLPRAEPTTGARSGEDHDEDHGEDHGEPPAQTGLYAYGITDAATDTRDIVGLDGRTPVETLPVGDTALVTSTIDLALLAGLESEVTETGQLSETGRLAELASRHDRVMRLLLERGPVLPLRFGTVLPDRERARRLLRASADDLAGELDRVRGHREWGLRVTPAEHDDDIDDESRDVTAGQATRETSAEAEAEAEAEADGEERRAATRTGAAADDGATPTSEGGTGTAYLSARREELRRAALREERLTELTRRVHDQLAVLSSEVTIRSGRPGPGRLSAAYLIASAAQDEFLDAAAAATRELTEAGCEARLTGPWPPYSFVRLTLGEARDV